MDEWPNIQNSFTGQNKEEVTTEINPGRSRRKLCPAVLTLGYSLNLRSGKGWFLFKDSPALYKQLPVCTVITGCQLNTVVKLKKAQFAIFWPAIGLRRSVVEGEDLVNEGSPFPHFVLHRLFNAYEFRYKLYS